MDKRKQIRELALENSNLILLIVMIVVGALLSQHFFTWDNMMNLLGRVSINGLVAIGFTMTLLAGGFDLSVGASLSLAAVFTVGIENSSGNAALAMVVALLAGLALGSLNGSLMVLTRGGTGEAFLITLATSLIGTSLALRYCNGYDLYGVHAAWYKFLGNGTILTIPVSSLIWIFFLVAVQIFIKKTSVGRKLLLAGANRRASYLAGINVKGLMIFAFAFAGFMAAIAGIIMSARTTAASPRSGTGADFDAAIASIIGGNSLLGGKGGMAQVFIGTMTYGMISNILNLIGIPSVMQHIVKGLILLLAIVLDNFKWRKWRQ